MKTLAAMVLAVSSGVFAQVPTITSFSPASGSIGTSVTIVGTNFSATASSNIVYFGGVKATVTNASTTSVTVAVPIGAAYAPISITTNGRTAYSLRPFAPTFLGAGFTSASSFQSPVTLTTGPFPVYAAEADFDGDGRLDIVVSNYNDNSISVYRNQATPGSLSAGSFASQQQLTTKPRPTFLSTGDMDGDGKLDLIVCYDTTYISVFLNMSTSGSITFGTRYDITTLGYTFDAAITDFDGDGIPDIVSNQGIWRNTSSVGALSFAARIGLPRLGYRVAVGDFDSDGKPDIAAAYSADSSLNVFRNTSTPGSISISAGISYKTGPNPWMPWIADFDGDGLLDIAVCYNNWNSTAGTSNGGVTLLRNTPTGSGTVSFSHQDIHTGQNNFWMTVGDLDGDGKPDIVTQGFSTSGAVAVFRNIASNGTLSGSSFATYDGNSWPGAHCVIGDLDGDGKPDIAMPSNWNSSNTISVIRNTMQSATITVNTPLQNMATNYAATVAWSSQFVPGTVDILLSTDNGNSFSTSIAFGAANTGSYTWNVPPDQPTSTSCKILILSSVDWSTSGISGTFSIVSGSSVSSTQNATVSVSYSDNPTSSQEYRLVSFPGLTDNVSVSHLNLPGAVDQDWSMYREPGTGTGFNELSTANTLKTGEGYWLIKKGPFTQSVSYPTPTPGSDGTVSITLSGGKYSIIGNPFNVPIPWSTVLALNPLLPPSTLLWTYGGNGWSATGNSDLQPGVGYYINSSGTTSLTIPYPFGGGFPSRAPGFQLQADWRLQLQYESEMNKDMENYVGIAPKVQTGKAGPDFKKPPAVFNQSFISLLPPNSDVAHNRFFADYRTNLGEGQIWHFDVVNPGKSQGTLSVVGVDKVPIAYGVLLVNEQTGETVNLREHNSIPYGYGKEVGHFRVIVGNSDFITAQAQKYIPKAYALDQNYPNPFNPSTTITFELPKESPVKIEIFSILGQRLKVLAEGVYEAGVHQVVWSGDTENGVKVSSGVYFCRLSSGKELVSVRKMILAK